MLKLPPNLEKYETFYEKINNKKIAIPLIVQHERSYECQKLISGGSKRVGISWENGKYNKLLEVIIVNPDYYTKYENKVVLKFDHEDDWLYDIAFLLYQSCDRINNIKALHNFFKNHISADEQDLFLYISGKRNLEAPALKEHNDFADEVIEINKDEFNNKDNVNKFDRLLKQYKGSLINKANKIYLYIANNLSENKINNNQVDVSMKISSGSFLHVQILLLHALFSIPCCT